MSFERILDSDGNPYQSEGELSRDAALGKKCYFCNQSFDAKSAFHAYTSGIEYEFKSASFPPHGDFSEATECIIEGRNRNACIFTAQQGRSFPEKVEEIVLSLVLWSEEEPKFEENQSYFIAEKYPWVSIPSNSRIDVLELLLCSLAAARESFCSTNGSLAFESKSFDWIDHGRMARVALGGFPFYSGKYGFLEFYRAIEVAHMSGVLQELNDEFFGGAGKAVERAQKSLSTDRDMFANFLKKVDVLDHFAIICDEVEKLDRGDNAFATALLANSKFSKTVRSKPSGINDQQWKGLTLSYEIRCAIAHAGASSLAVEEYSDFDDVLKIATPLLEKVIFQCLGLTSK